MAPQPVELSSTATHAVACGFVRAPRWQVCSPWRQSWVFSCPRGLPGEGKLLNHPGWLGELRRVAVLPGSSFALTRSHFCRCGFLARLCFQVGAAPPGVGITCRYSTARNIVEAGNMADEHLVRWRSQTRCPGEFSRLPSYRSHASPPMSQNLRAAEPVRRTPATANSCYAQVKCSTCNSFTGWPGGGFRSTALVLGRRFLGPVVA